MTLLKKCVFILIGLTTFSCLASPKSNKFIPPKVNFEIATRQLIDNIDVNKGIHIFNLYCVGDWCELSLTSLECEAIGVERGFVPKGGAWSSRAGFLEISAMSKGVLELTVFQTSHRGFPAKIRFEYIPASKDYETSTRVTEFKAEGFFNLKLFPQSIKHVDYIPIIGSPHVEPLGCGVLVPGIEKKP
jgi:hypothetical protein